MAEQYGEVLGAEARGQGIDVSQGPNLNIDRVPTSGRADESYGEDPLLTTELGLADIQGIQARGVMADAKHLVAYSQETNRGALDAVVPDRALQEIYLPPFKAAVTQGHVATLMCAYPQLDGNFQCQDPALGLVLQQWGFAGFVRSDLGAVHDQPHRPGLRRPAAEAVRGRVADRPDRRHRLTAGHRRRRRRAGPDRDVRLRRDRPAGHRRAGHPGQRAQPHRLCADRGRAVRRAAEEPGRACCPLHPPTVGSVAVIGADASTHPVTQGFGSSHVVPPFTSTPLAAITDRLRPGATVRYAEGGSTTRHLPTRPDPLPHPGCRARATD